MPSHPKRTFAVATLGFAYMGIPNRQKLPAGKFEALEKLAIP